MHPFSSKRQKSVSTTLFLSSLYLELLGTVAAAASLLLLRCFFSSPFLSILCVFPLYWKDRQLLTYSFSTRTNTSDPRLYDNPEAEMTKTTKNGYGLLGNDKHGV